MDRKPDLDMSETPAIPKFSRYRSVRRAALNEPESTTPPIPVSQVGRAPSRYRRQRKATSQQPFFLNTEGQCVDPKVGHETKESKAGPVQLRTKVIKGQSGGKPRSHEEVRGEQILRRSPVKELQVDRHDDRKSQNRSSGDTCSTGRLSTGHNSLQAAREEARMILEGEADRLYELKIHQTARRRALPQLSKLANSDTHKEGTSQLRQADKARLLQKQPLQSEEDDHGSHPQNLDRRTSKQTRKLVGGPTVANAHRAEPQSISEQFQPFQAREILCQRKEVEMTDDKPDLQAQKVATFDAPVSAINIGDRRVQIQKNHSIMTLAFTPTTTVKDILISASACMSEDIDPYSDILVECFSQLGLERPLRRYERIRDVLNSWDNDSENHLFIFSGDEIAAVGLDLEDAPLVQPSEVSMRMHHSPSPGKWDKRWINLREDGQVTISKHESAVETTKICHISDFDIYTPARKQIKKIKAPKKLCFAIKSQQKSAMFLSGANFAHFFCSSDKAVADRWYQAIQTWRSWYLVRVLGAGEMKTSDTRQIAQGPERNSIAKSASSVRQPPGSFKFGFDNLRLVGGDASSAESKTSSDRADPLTVEPLLNFSTERQSSQFRNGNFKRCTQNQGLRPSSFPKRRGFDSIDPTTGDTAEVQAFTGSGLLARSASKRSQGGHASGRGIQGVAGKPLVDLSIRSKFTDGSLLHQVEAWYGDKGGTEPRIDREKRHEVMTAIGENV